MIPAKLFIWLLPLMLFSAQQHALSVTIEYNGLKPSKTVTTTYTEGANALETLQGAAEVKTYSVGEYLFVRSIDGVAGTPGETGWFFSIDGISAEKTASSTILKDAASMQWQLRKQNCLSR